MMHWFIWQGKNSLKDFNLWIGKLPKITRAPERYDTVQIPGRAGDMIRKVKLITRNTNPKLQAALGWLRGSSDLIFSNEAGYIYTARIVNEVDFDRIGNDLLQAEVQFYCDPLKKSANADRETVTLTASGSIYNRGDVASRPIVKITATGNKTITIGTMSMAFSNLSGTVVVDCDAGIITKNGAIWTESVTGDFWRIPTGTVSVTLPSSTTVEIQPNWRWV